MVARYFRQAYSHFHALSASAPRYAAVATISTMLAALYFKFKEYKRLMSDDMTCRLSVVVITFEDRPDGTKRCRPRGLVERPVHRLYESSVLRHMLSRYTSQMLPGDVFVPIPAPDVWKFLHPIVGLMNEIFAVPTMASICNTQPTRDVQFRMALTLTGQYSWHEASEPQPQAPLPSWAFPLQYLPAPARGIKPRTQPVEWTMSTQERIAVLKWYLRWKAKALKQPMDEKEIVRQSILGALEDMKQDELLSQQRSWGQLAAPAVPRKYRAYLISEADLRALPPESMFKWDKGKENQQRTAYRVARQMQLLSRSAYSRLLWGPIEFALPSMHPTEALPLAN